MQETGGTERSRNRNHGLEKASVWRTYLLAETGNLVRLNQADSLKEKIVVLTVGLNLFDATCIEAVNYLRTVDGSSSVKTVVDSLDTRNNALLLPNKFLFSVPCCTYSRG